MSNPSQNRQGQYELDKFTEMQNLIAKLNKANHKDAESCKR